MFFRNGENLKIHAQLIRESVVITQEQGDMASGSSIRAFGSFLCRLSFTHQSSLSILERLSSSGKLGSVFQNPSTTSVRNIRTSAPLCMGRRSCKIAGRKTSQDAKKAKLCSKVGKQVVSAVKRGGTNPVSNTALAAIYEKIKELDVPKDIVERNIKRALEKGQEDFIEKIYEVYGYGGVGIVVEVSTDNINRSIQAIRGVVKDFGGKMADSGSILFKFNRVRVVNIKVTDTDKDQLLSVALDVGAEDVIEPSMDEDYSDDDSSERVYKVVGASQNYTEILSKLRDAGIPCETDGGSELLPVSTIEVDDEAMELNKQLISKFLELDDVDAVYTDQKY